MRSEVSRPFFRRSVFGSLLVVALLAPALPASEAASRPEASPRYLRFRRGVTVPGRGSQACATLDAAVLTHASPSLKDLRLYAGTGGGASTLTEIPYATTLSEPLEQDTDDARILNLGLRSGHIVFDLAMPRRAYSAINLELDAHDFIATASVTGSQTLSASNPIALGTFTLFDLSAQHLSHSTTLALAESTLPYLHVDLALSPAPGNLTAAIALNRPDIVRSATVPPSREAQTLYTTLQQTGTLVLRGHESIATFQLPARVPIERVAFTLPPGYKGSFSRLVRIDAHILPGQKSDIVATQSDPISEDDTTAATETATGTILSVHKLEAGHEIAREDLAIPTAIGANMQHLAELQVIIENGDDAPLPLAQVQLQMRQRRICFDPASPSTPAGNPTAVSLTLYYGDPALEAPVYDYAKLFQPVAIPVPATLGPELLNPIYTPRRDTRPFTEQHQELLWIALLAVVCILALTAFRSAKHLPR